MQDPSADAKNQQKAQNRWEAVVLILRDFIQSESTLSLDEAVDRVAVVYNDGEHGVNIDAIVVELSEELSYDEPGNMKLAQFWVAFADSGKWVANSKYKDDPKAARRAFYEAMDIFLYSSVPDINTDDPDYPNDENLDPTMYVNAQAFRANLWKLTYRGKHPLSHLISNLTHAVLHAFHDYAKNETPEVRDALVMGAAQWPTKAASETFALVQNSHDQAPTSAEEGEGKAPGCLPFLERRKARKEQERVEKRHRKIRQRWPIKWEEWQTWKEGFRAAASDAEMYGETCRKLAEEAADLMALQEKAMQDLGIARD